MISERRRALDLTIIFAMVALIAATMVIVRLFENGSLRPLYSSMTIVSLLLAYVAGRGRARLAALIGLAAFAALILIGLFDNYSCNFGSTFAFIPPLALFCLLTADHLLSHVGAFALAIIPLWYFLAPGRSIDLDVTLSIAAYTLLALGLSIFVRQDLRYARVDKVAALAELQHRVRNSLQILLTLATWRRAERRPALLLAQTRALRAVHAAAAGSADLRVLSAAGFLEQLRGALVASLPGSRVDFTAAGSLAIEIACPLALIIAELLEGSGQAHIHIDLRLEEGRGSLRVDCVGYSADQPRRMPSLRAGGSGQVLLAQICAEPRDDPHRWGIDFAADQPMSKHEPEGLVAARYAGPRLERLLGEGRATGSPDARRKATSFALFSLSVIGLFSLIEITATLAGLPHRWILFGAIPVGFGGIILVRAGKFRAGVAFIALVLFAAITVAAFAGSGAASGVQLFAVPSVFLYCMHFLGRRWGIAAGAWGGLLFLAWFFLAPGRILPDEYFGTLLVAFLSFIVACYFLLRDFGDDLRDKESLVVALQERLGDHLDLLAVGLEHREDEAGTAGDPGETARSLALYERRLRDIERAHGIVSNYRDPGDVEMSKALLAMLAPCRMPTASPEIQATGSLSVEKALSALLLAAELQDLAYGALAGEQGRVKMLFQSEGGKARLLVTAVNDMGEVRWLGAPDSEATRLLEAQLEVRRAEYAGGSYVAVFSA